MVRRMTLAAVMILLGTSLAVSACGKKPGDITAPQGKKQDQFPHTYPRDSGY
ncbi:MAG: hypothetical protein M3O22_07750 [Pseudomonadota bacterium]|nr:hypothetical protein [Pseudomonadota bacterium]